MFGDTTWTVCRGLERDLIYEEVDSKEAKDENGLAIVSLLPEDRLAPEAGATIGDTVLCSQTPLGTQVAFLWLGAQQCHHIVCGVNEFL